VLRGRPDLIDETSGIDLVGDRADLCDGVCRLA
jgi:hypothetical protein